MLSRNEVYDIVEGDVSKGLSAIFAPRNDDGPAFSLLDVGGFTFTPEDIPDGAAVAAVAWRYHAVHRHPMIAEPGEGADRQPIATLNREPPSHIADAPYSTGIRETLRPVTIAGVTLVVARTDADTANPTVLRFVDWADVYSQLGLTFVARVPEPSADPGYQRIQQVK